MSATVAGPAAKFDPTAGSAWSPAHPQVGCADRGTLGAAGAEVVLTGRTAERLQQTASALSHPSLVVPGDLRDATFRAALIDAVRDRHGRLDVLVNAAGICDRGLLENQALADIADVIEIDLLVAIDLCRLAAPLLLDRPGLR